MNSQMVLSLEGLLADLADVLPLVAVRQFVLRDGARVAEDLKKKRKKQK